MNCIVRMRDENKGRQTRVRVSTTSPIALAYSVVLPD